MTPATKYSEHDSDCDKVYLGRITALLQAHKEGHLASSESVQVDGYIQSIRKQKKKAFASLQDGQSLDTLQAVIPPDLAEG